MPAPPKVYFFMPHVSQAGFQMFVGIDPIVWVAAIGAASALVGHWFTGLSAWRQLKKKGLIDVAMAEVADRDSLRKTTEEFAASLFAENRTLRAEVAGLHKTNGDLMEQIANLRAGEVILNQWISTQQREIDAIKAARLEAEDGREAMRRQLAAVSQRLTNHERICPGREAE